MYDDKFSGRIFSFETQPQTLPNTRSCFTHVSLGELKGKVKATATDKQQSIKVHACISSKHTNNMYKITNMQHQKTYRVPQKKLALAPECNFGPGAHCAAPTASNWLKKTENGLNMAGHIQEGFVGIM